MLNSPSHITSADQLNTGSEISFEKLLGLATGFGRDVGVITEILRFLDAHPQLIDFPRIIQGLLNALNEMEKPPALFLGDVDLMVWRHECRWIISNRSNPRFISALGPRYYFGDETRKHNPILDRASRITRSRMQCYGMSPPMLMARQITTGL
jgi:hypothetical protein